jgi:hypothetical protein
MPFDPNFPQDGARADAPSMRGQLNALNDKIEAQAAQLAGQDARLAALETQLAAAISDLTALLDARVGGCALNPLGVGQMSHTISDPPTQWEVGTILNTTNALIAALRREGS